MTQGSWSRYLKVYDPLKAGSIDGTDTRPHDRGIERAMESVYVPDKNLQSDPIKTLFVGRLNPETTEETLHKAFSKYGEIKSLNLVRDIITGFSKQYAFIEFDLHGDADEACQEMHGNYLDNHNIFVDWECGRVFPKWLPRRLGGGLGGRKESGQLRFGGKDRPFKKPFILSNTGQGAGRGREEVRGFEGKGQRGDGRGREEVRGYEGKGQRGDGRGRDVKEMDRGYNRDKGYRSTRREGSYEPEYREKRGDRSRDRQREGYRERSQEKETDRYRRRDRDKHGDRDGYRDDRGSYRRDDKERYRERRRDRKESEEKVSKRRRRGDSEEREERQDGRNERSERYGQTRRFTEEKVATREGNGSPDRDDRRKRRFIEGKREGTSEYYERYTEGEKKPWSRRKFTEMKGEEDP